MHPPIRPALLPIAQPLPRCFSTTNELQARPSRSALKHLHRNIPKYPHGPSLLYKKSNFGLYGGAMPQFGNKVSERNEVKTRRRWDPNIHDKRLWSVAMDRYLRVKVQARVLRTIDKVGGLDEYLMGESPARIKELGMEGWRMRWRLMNTAWGQQRRKERRVGLGLGPQGVTMVLDDAILLGEEGQQGVVEEGGEDGEDKEVELRFKDDDGEGGDEYEEVTVTDEERDRILEEDPQTKGGRLPWEPTEAAQVPPRKSIFQRLTGR
ncbi:MAG: hypothetical protein LQ346_005568 [Caloplaca aetnensis]|nr:MAG: hypothetical protein LQ346_005568 [Caloplaca aetnensis]